MNIQIKTFTSLFLAAALTACSPFTDDPVNNNVGEGVAITESSGVLTAAITDVEGVNTAAGVAYAWYLNGVLIQGETASSYTLQAGQSADDITVGVSYTDLAGTAEAFDSPVTTSSGTAGSNQFASITDMDTSDSGELRYKFPSGMSTGKASFIVTYPAGETERFYMTLFDTATNNAGMIGELQMDEGKFYNRVGGSSTAISAPDFTPGTPVSVVLKWDTAAASPTYTIEIDGTFTQSFTAENAAEVTHLSLKLSSNGGTAANAVQVDDLAIYSDQAGATEVFTDDFESYAVGHGLDASPYNSSTFSAVVGGGASTTPTTPAVNDNTGEGVALTESGGVLTTTITDTEGVDNASVVTYAWYLNDVLIQGETASSYTLQSGQTAAGITSKVNYTDVAGTSEEFVSPEIVINDTGEGVAVTESGGVLTATITDSEGVDASSGVTYAWYLNGALIQGETASSYTLQSGEAADDVTVSVSYTDLAGTTEVFDSPQTVTAPVATTNQFASITDTDTGDTGELRYAFPNDLTEGQVSLSVLYPAGEEQTFYISLFDAATSTSSLVGELQMDEGNFKRRILKTDGSGGTTSSTISGANFTEGTPVSVVMKWNTSVAGAVTYTFEVDGTEILAENAMNAAPVTHLSLRLSDNSKTTAYAIEVDDIKIYSDEAGTTEVFSDDFEGYSVGDDLDVDVTSTSPYHGNTFSTVVAGTAPTTPTSGPSNHVASITDTDTGDTGELRYAFPNDLTAGQVSLSVLYPAGEEQTFYISLFDENTSTSSLIGELQMDEGNYKHRVLKTDGSGGTTSSTISGANFTEGTPVSVVLKWNTIDTSASTYTFEVDGTHIKTENAMNAAPVTHLSLRLSDNSKTTAYAIEVDDIKIYSDEAGTTEVFSDDFEGYSVGDDLDVDVTTTSPYHKNTFSTAVAVGSVQP